MSNQKNPTLRIYDLLNIGDQNMYDVAKQKIAVAFPQLQLADASDGIHQFRLEVQGELELGVWLKWLMTNGLVLMSLICQDMRLTNSAAYMRLLRQAVQADLAGEEGIRIDYDTNDDTDDDIEDTQAE